MNKDNLHDCQKYYIFKMRDLVNNSFHTLEEKRMESLSQYLDLCICTYDEFLAALDPGKFKKAYDGLLNGIDYQMQNHPFRKLDLYKNDFSYLHRLIRLEEKERDKELHNIHRNLVSLKKKLNASDIIEGYIQCLHQEEIFGEMDFLMEALISDLLNQGYSMDYLFNWFRHQQDVFMNNGQDLAIIDRLRELSKKPEGFIIYIKFVVNSISQLEPALQLLKRHFTINRKGGVAFAEKWSQKDFYVAGKEYLALDVTKAITMAHDEFIAVRELFDMWQGSIGCIQEDLRYGWIQNNELHLKDVTTVDTVKMLGYMDTYYKKQMDRFLNLKDKGENEDIKILERILYTLNTAKMYKVQNRFLNFWSALEYTLYPFPRTAIIEKARVIVPKTFSLFYVKNKMNIFWARLNFYLEKRKDKDNYRKLIDFVQECQDIEDVGYMTKKVIEFFQNPQKTQGIVENLSNHVVLKRECLELQMLINVPSKAYAAIKSYHDGIKHDLNYIYRLRNQLIHSTRADNSALEYVSMRLYRYVNSVLSTVLYYKEKNGAYGITDILSSIDATFRNYESKWNTKPASKEGKKGNSTWSLADAYQMVRPSYLFME